MQCIVLKLTEKEQLANVSSTTNSLKTLATVSKARRLMATSRAVCVLIKIEECDNLNLVKIAVATEPFSLTLKKSYKFKTGR